MLEMLLEATVETLFSGVLALVSSTGELAAAGQRAAARRRLRMRVTAALLDHRNDLSSLARELEQLALDLYLRQRRSDRKTKFTWGDSLAKTAAAVRHLRIAVAIERGDLTLAERELADSPNEQPATKLLLARVNVISRGERTWVDEKTFDAFDAIASLPDLLVNDTRVQLALALHQRVTTQGPVLPLTAARICASQGRHEEATVWLREASPARVDALIRLYPEDQAARLAQAIRNGSPPYR